MLPRLASSATWPRRRSDTSGAGDGDGITRGVVHEMGTMRRRGTRAASTRASETLSVSKVADASVDSANRSQRRRQHHW